MGRGMGFNFVSLFTFALIGELVVVAALALLLRSTRRAIDLTELQGRTKRFTK
jgi:hypothetical protein